MDWFNLTQCQKLLETNNHRLKKLLEICGIVPEVSRKDGKQRLVTAAQVEQLLAAHHAVPRAGIAKPTSEGMPSSDPAQLIKRLAAAEDRIAYLEQLWGLSGSPQTPRHAADPPTVAYLDTPRVKSQRSASEQHKRPRDNRRTTEVEDLPAGLLPITALARAHGVNENTATKQRKAGYFVVKGPYKVERNTNAWAVDQENAERALRHWRERGLLVQCEDPTCLCHAMAAGPQSPAASEDA